MLATHLLELEQNLAPLSEDLHFLVSYIGNVRQQLQELNPSIGTYLNDQTAARMKQRLLDDVQGNPFYDAELRHAESGTVVYVNRAIINARCDVLASRIAQGRCEFELEPQLFRLIIEYIYTEHVTGMEMMAQSGSVETLIRLMEAASSYGLTRLTNLCELYLSKCVERDTAASIAHCTIDLPSILERAYAARANQLVDFILHWLCTNYEAVSKRQDILDRLAPRHRLHLEANQWPPRSYIEQVERYEEDMAAWRKRQGAEPDAKCSIQ